MATADASSHPGQDHHDTPHLEHTFPKAAQAEPTISTDLQAVGGSLWREIAATAGEQRAGRRSAEPVR